MRPDDVMPRFQSHHPERIDYPRSAPRDRFIDIAREIITPVAPRPRPRTPGTRAEQEVAWDALARAMGWPLHRSDRAVDAPSLAQGRRVAGGES